MVVSRRQRSRRGATLTGVAPLVVLLGCLGGLPSIAQSPGDEPTAWQLLDDGDPAPGDGVFVYDTVRQVPVRVRNGGGDQPSTTWELVGEDWVRRFLPEPTPHGPGASCFAFDPDRGVLVMFGGVNPETWEYEGTSWTQRFPTTTPPDRGGCSMVYDSGRQRMVMFGGDDDNQIALGDTWEYDGADWTPIDTRNKPSARYDAALAYDASTGEVVLFGGWTLVPTFIFGDMWVYDGRNWRQKTPSRIPAARRGAGMAYDPVRQKVVMFGGTTTTMSFGDTWEWDGHGWTQVATPSAPQPRWYFRMDYDTQRGKVIGHGGFPNDGDYNDTWVYDGTTWTQIAISGLPSPRKAFAMAYDPAVDAVVMYGGNGPSPETGQIVDLSETWQLEQGSWVLQDSAGTPSVFDEAKTVWDPDHDRLVGFSGTHYTVAPRDLHEYAGSPPGWTSSPTCCPDGRYGHGWSYAPSLGGIVLFGGRACCGPTGGFYLTDDTWVLDGYSWTQYAPAQSPGTRMAMAMGYHAGSGLVVLQGGTTISGSPSGKQSDTWLFDGTDWQLMAADSAPGARYEHSMIYDAARDRLVLYGDGTPLDGITWEFDGSQWIARSTPFQPESDRCWNPLAYDSKREVVILFGGRDCSRSIYWNDTWAYGPDPDGDGVVGKLDNCTQVANADQANADGDPAGDVCDCAAGDPGSFAPPVEVSGLALEGAGTTSLTWADQSGAVGSAVVYDVATGVLSDLRSSGYAGATCLAQSLTTPSASDGRVPAAGDGYWHLVRSRNACGTGSYGPGRAALDAATPCP